MICGNCNQEIPYDTKTVARHLDGKCGLRDGFITVNVVTYAYSFLKDLLDDDLIDHNSFRQAEIYRNTVKAEIYTKDPVVPYNFLNDLLNTSNIGCLILKEGRVCLKLR